MRTATFLGSCVLAIALVATYVALGGTSYEPTPVANPCAPRPTRPAGGTDELEHALRDGLVRAVGQAEDEDLIGDSTAGALRFAAEHLPLGLLLDLLRRASSILG